MNRCKCGCGLKPKKGKIFIRGHNLKLSKYHFSGSVKGKRPDVARRNRLVNPTKTGKDAYNWKGGISKERTKAHHSEKYKQWRNKIFKRDNYTCRNCGRKRKKGDRVILEAHHIKEWSKYPTLRYNIDNGLTLCKECHNLTKGINQYSNNRKLIKVENNYTWER